MDSEVDENREFDGRFKPGHNVKSPGRPAFSIVSIIKAKLQDVPEGQQEALIDILIDEYIDNVRTPIIGGIDGVAMRDLIDRFDGKPKQHVAVSDDRREAWRDLQREAFIQPDSEEDMESLQADETEAADTGRRSTFGKDVAE